MSLFTARSLAVAEGHNSSLSQLGDSTVAIESSSLVLLKCCKCYKKIKKVLCRYPQIRDQIYDEKDNRVFIRVVCSSPECIMEKIICKAGDTVESIEIMPDKHKEPEKPKPAEKPKEPEKPKPVEKPKDPPKPEKPKVVTVEPPKEAANPPAPKPPMPAPDPPPKAPKPVVQGFPWPPPQEQVPMYPIGVCCCCCEGGPGYCRRGPTCYDGSGRPAYEYQGSNRGYYMSRCDEYLSEENASGCGVM
ncbi:hypothetical protein MLD38_036727 [Melastoma candidum]|uniref:Uncharacterized protein n=1 Tax=Melastoma candidum TaxID=119954 RepID=A0ACB9LKU6_9MYRT|nr:hypothetical protein MLD38_036727 [Melastoma candidum]